MTIVNSKYQFYSKEGLWSLFLMCAFPLHFWTLILAFRDLSWLIERSNFWDAISVAAYGMIFAFIESVVIFLIAALLGFLISKHWGHQQRVALMGILVLVTALWSMAGQVFALLGLTIPTWLGRFLFSSGHPLRYLYLICLFVIVPTVLLPTYVILKPTKALQSIREFIDRITLLATFYLSFDVIALVIVLVRNIGERYR
jgi:hypothetical protein